MTDDTVGQVCNALAVKLRLGSITPRVIGRYSNLAVALDPLPIVARIATGTGLLRDTEVYAQREVAIASYLAACGAPVVHPCSDPPAGPYRVDGWTITLWKRAVATGTDCCAIEAGNKLAVCHALLRGYSAKLPYFGAFEELRQLLAHPHVQKVLARADRDAIGAQARGLRRALDAKSADAQMLHGDAHRKNVIQTPDDVLWIDWEDAIFAPVEWDLACLVTTARVTGQNRDWAEAALSAYGAYDAPALELCVQARALFAIAWLALLSADDPARLARLHVWLTWLRTQ